ncbi:MAG TPA: glycoside hydrolase family 28 protein [Verrucomicrobiae bacterium]|nr:glycoside hydrolase family 28 protein [Verrucomicrobiae bacterium]
MSSVVGFRQAQWRHTFLLAICVGVIGCVKTAQDSKTANADPWARVPGILKRMVPPRFPDRDFLVTRFGAVGDGATDCTRAFADAIAACNAAGGGRVVVPEGVFVSGAIHLKSKVNLHVSEGATIRFMTNAAAYLPVVFTRYECTEVMNFSPPIYAFEQTNIAITGRGTLDGQGRWWHQWLGKWGADSRALVGMGNRNLPVAERVFGEGHFLRPNFIQPVRCRNVLIEGVRVINSPMWTLHPLYCTNVTIRGVTVETRGPNTDGCDPDSCTDVLIENCVFSNGDDCIAVKSGRDGDGRRVNIPSEKIVIRNCVFRDGHGGVTMGSETSGGIRNVFAENCQFDSPDLDMAMRFKSNPARGGFVENIYLRNCTVKTAKYGIHMTLRYGAAGARDGEHPPRLRNIEIRDSKFGELTRGPIFIEGYAATNQITDVTVANCDFVPGKGRVVVTNAVRISLLNCTGLGAE